MPDPSLGRILIVDDEQTVRDVLAEYFVEQGYQVSTASSGVEALRGLAESHPDLVLLDVRMPASTASRRCGGCAKWRPGSPSSW